jgi:hypothetical protein
MSRKKQGENGGGEWTERTAMMDSIEKPIGQAGPLPVWLLLLLLLL